MRPLCVLKGQLSSTGSDQLARRIVNVRSWPL